MHLCLLCDPANVVALQCVDAIINQPAMARPASANNIFVLLCFRP